MTDIRLWNTATKRKDPLEPLVEAGHPKMYVCGPTVYDRAHLGNARPAVVFDVLFRLLRHCYGAENVTYVRNFTDVDDKINARAAETGRPIAEITEETMRWYLEDMAALGVREPKEMPRATAYIRQMVAMIEALVAKGHAYAAEGHVLFRVRSYGDYGALSRRSLDDMQAGARVEVAPYKEDPLDFVLWKPSTDDLPGWDSPWGRGRPGWHIECSAMAADLLGERFDIHGGGNDLIFPHHENEIAQSRCMGHDFARIWMHNEMLQVEGRKMAKSAGNFFTVRDLIRDYDTEFAIPNIGPAIRLRFLRTHYRSPIDISKREIEAEAAKLDQWLHVLDGYDPLQLSTEDAREAMAGCEFLDALSDDLNTALAVTWLDKVISQLGRPLAGPVINEEVDERLALAKQVFVALEILGVDLAAAQGLRHSTWSRRLKERAVDVQPIVESAIERRQTARAERDFATADRLRDALAAAGVVVKDTPQGVVWELEPDFDPSKLEALK